VWASLIDGRVQSDREFLRSLVSTRAHAMGTRARSSNPSTGTTRRGVGLGRARHSPGGGRKTEGPRIASFTLPPEQLSERPRRGRLSRRAASVVERRWHVSLPGTDGTRTRALRRDRPVMALPAERAKRGFPGACASFWRPPAGVGGTTSLPSWPTAGWGPSPWGVTDTVSHRIARVATGRLSPAPGGRQKLFIPYEQRVREPVRPAEDSASQLMKIGPAS
jgi:hypothetical protein